MHGLDHTNFLGKFFSGGEVPRFRLGGDFFFGGGASRCTPLWPCMAWTNSSKQFWMSKEEVGKSYFVYSRIIYSANFRYLKKIAREKD
jgi:hypothetical protein